VSNGPVTPPFEELLYLIVSRIVYALSAYMCTGVRFGYNCNPKLLGRPTLVGKALSITHELSFFLFLPIHRAQ